MNMVFPNQLKNVPCFFENFLQVLHFDKGLIYFFKTSVRFGSWHLQNFTDGPGAHPGISKRQHEQGAGVFKII